MRFMIPEELSKIDGENLRVAVAAFISQVEKRSTAYQFCPSLLSFLHVSNLASYVEVIALAFTADVIKAIDKLENVKDPFLKRYEWRAFTSWDELI